MRLVSTWPKHGGEEGDWEKCHSGCPGPEGWMSRARGVDVPSQRGANITMCAAISSDRFLLHKPLIGPYNTERLISFLGDLYGRVVPGEDRVAARRNRPTFVIIWDNVAFHQSRAVTEWFAAHPRMVSLFLPRYSPLLNPTEEVYFPLTLHSSTPQRKYFPPTLLSTPRPHRGSIFLPRYSPLLNPNRGSIFL
jgi:hypothetical protein